MPFFPKRTQPWCRIREFRTRDEPATLVLRLTTPLTRGAIVRDVQKR
jgi:hypothetical protein